MMGLKKVKYYNSGIKLAEINQSTGMVFALANKIKDDKFKYIMCHDWVKCRDFLHDAARAQLTRSSCIIYAFQYTAGKDPEICFDKTYMLVSKLNSHLSTNEHISNFKEEIKSALKLLRHFERQAKVTLSTVEEVDSEDSKKKIVYLFKSPALWMSSPFLISMYSFIIRLGTKKLKFKTQEELQKQLKVISENKNNCYDNDSQYLKTLWDKMHLIIQNVDSIFTKKNNMHDYYFKDIGIATFHNNSGILSLAKGVTANLDLNKSIKTIINK